MASSSHSKDNSSGNPDTERCITASSLPSQVGRPEFTCMTDTCLHQIALQCLGCGKFLKEVKGTGATVQTGSPGWQSGPRAKETNIYEGLVYACKSPVK